MVREMLLSGPMSALRKRLGDEGTIRHMAAAGFDAVDYTFNEMVDADCVWNGTEYEAYARHLMQVAKQEGICFNQAHAPFLFDWHNMWQKEGFEQVIFPAVERSILCASLLEIPHIIVHPIHHLVYRGREEQMLAWNVEYFHRLLPLAEKYGVKLAVENMWKKDPNRGCPDIDVFANPWEFRDFIDGLNSPWAVACVDVGHVALSGENPVRMLHTMGSRVKAVHIHDNHFREDDHTLPYLGDLDWDGVTKALADIGYDGDFTFEVTNYFSGFDDGVLDAALKMEVAVGRHLIEKIKAYSQEATGIVRCGRPVVG